jgi:hypothetical protein
LRQIRRPRADGIEQNKPTTRASVGVSLIASSAPEQSLLQDERHPAETRLQNAQDVPIVSRYGLVTGQAEA